MSLPRFHQSLTGREPSELHLKFYEASARGFNKGDFNEEEFLSPFVLAIHQATRGPVIVIVPRALEQEVLGAITSESRRILRRFRGKPEPVKRFTDAVKRLKLAGKMADNEPERWVSFGLSDKDPIPSWLKSKLWPMTT